MSIPCCRRTALLLFTRGRAAAAAVGITNPTSSAPLSRAPTSCGASIWTAATTGSLKGRGGDPEHQLCDFKSKQFSSDSRRLYFLNPAWATSDALHAFDVRGGEEHFLLPANDFLVLNFCRSKYKDHLVVLSHRYFLFGGSYDWYWLYDPAGKKEIGPVGHFDDRDDLLRQAHGEWCEGKP
jgi:hypothetical protein